MSRCVFSQEKFSVENMPRGLRGLKQGSEYAEPAQIMPPLYPEPAPPTLKHILPHRQLHLPYTADATTSELVLHLPEFIFWVAAGYILENVPKLTELICLFLWFYRVFYSQSCF